jgi:glycine cleavage system aminomethyltransferase T
VHHACGPIWTCGSSRSPSNGRSSPSPGPKARALLNAVLDAPIDDDELPLHGLRPGHVHGIAGRLFRISFSGEHAYEIAVPARYGEALFATWWPGPRRWAAGPTGWRR